MQKSLLENLWFRVTSSYMINNSQFRDWRIINLQKLLSLDSPLMRIMARIFDLIILNLLFIILCIPIISIGANISAMSYVMLQIHRKEDTYPIRTYFKIFKDDFIRATLLWIPLLFISICLGLDFWALDAAKRAGIEPPYMSFFAILLFVIYCISMQYALPRVPWMRYGVVKELRESLYYAIKYLPLTFAMVAITVLPPAFFFFIFPRYLFQYIRMMFLMGFSGMAFLQTTFLNVALKDILKQ